MYKNAAISDENMDVKLLTLYKENATLFEHKEPLQSLWVVYMLHVARQNFWPYPIYPQHFPGLLLWCPLLQDLHIVLSVHIFILNMHEIFATRFLETKNQWYIFVEIYCFHLKIQLLKNLKGFTFRLKIWASYIFFP